MAMPDVQETILSAKTIPRPTTIPHVVRAAMAVAEENPLRPREA